MKYEIYRDRRGEWRWRLKAANGRILAVSSEGYDGKHNCVHCLLQVKDSRLASVKEV